MKLFSFLYKGKSDQTSETHFKHIKYSNDDEYQGELLHDLRHGQGTYKFANGNRYVGQWKEHQKHGQGKYYYQNGELYIGQWYNNKKQGAGTHFYVNGDRYVGQWCQNMKDGQGIVYYSDQSIFVGQFKQNKRSGIGYFYNPREKKFLQQLYDEDAIMESTEIPHPPKEYQEIFRVNSSNQKHVQKFLDREDPPPLPNINESPTIQQDSDRKVKSGSAPCESDHQQKKSNDDASSQAGFETLQILENMEQIEKQKKMQDWDIDEVCNWLDQLNLPQYKDAFKQNQMSGKTLYDLSDAELKEDLGINVLGHRKIILNQIELHKKYYMKLMQGTLMMKKKNVEQIDNKGNIMSVFNSIDQQKYVRLFSYMEKIEKIDEEEDIQMPQDSSDNSAVKKKKKPKDESSSSSSSSGKKKSSQEGSSDKSIKLKKQKSKRFKKRKQTSELVKSINGDSADEESSPQQYLLNNSNKTSPIRNNKQEQGSQGIMEQKKSFQEELVLEEITHNTTEKVIDIQPSQGGTQSPQNNIIDGTPLKMVHFEDTDFIDAKLPVLEKQQSNQTHISQKMVNLEKKSNSDPINFKQDDDSSSQESDVSSVSSSSSSSSEPQKGKTSKRSKKEKESYKHKGKRIKAFNMNKFMSLLQEFGINEKVLIKYQELTFGPVIGEGGYGVVYKGRWLGQDVAIKSYGKRKTSGKLRYRLQMADFLKEVEVISNLRHPNIVLYMGFCYKKFNYYLITEYLDQGSLFDHLHKKKTQVDQKALMQIVEDIALGMNYLHGRKVLHCDLKSSNVLIDQNWNVKLCDFGLSQIKKKIDHKKSSRRIGTPHWMAPEIMRGETYKEQADVYSFGMILWEIITCKVPYEGLSQTQIIGSVGYGNEQIEIPKVSNPPILAQLAQMCLDKDPAKRPDFNQIVRMIQKGQRSEAQIKKQAIQLLVEFFE